MATQITNELDALLSAIENNMTFLNARLQDVNTFRLNLDSTISDLRTLFDPILQLTDEQEVKDALENAQAEIATQIDQTNATAEAFTDVLNSVDSVIGGYRELIGLLQAHVLRVTSRY